MMVVLSLLQRWVRFAMWQSCLLSYSVACCLYLVFRTVVCLVDTSSPSLYRYICVTVSTSSVLPQCLYYVAIASLLRPLLGSDKQNVTKWSLFDDLGRSFDRGRITRHVVGISACLTLQSQLTNWIVFPVSYHGLELTDATHPMMTLRPINRRWLSVPASSRGQTYCC